jgi:hypothetical protein
MTPAQNTRAYIQGFEDGERAAKVKMLREREWVELTDEDMADITSLPIGTCAMMLKVEAKLKEKNT